MFPKTAVVHLWCNSCIIFWNPTYVTSLKSAKPLWYFYGPLLDTSFEASPQYLHPGTRMFGFYTWDPMTTFKGIGRFSSCPVSIFYLGHFGDTQTFCMLDGAFKNASTCEYNAMIIIPIIVTILLAYMYRRNLIWVPIQRRNAPAMMWHVRGIMRPPWSNATTYRGLSRELRSWRMFDEQEVMVGLGFQSR